MKSLRKNSSVVIKAISGGGGRGMRVVSKTDELRESFDRAASEAKASFNSPDLYLEEYLKNYRHIEFQIIGDGTGAVSHLHERECSIQRRYQKLIEIAPSPSLNPELKTKMIEASLVLAQTVKYEGLATIEFLVNVEKNDFRSLGAPVFAKGHLRKYAKIVKVDEAKVVADYCDISQENEAPPLVISKTEIYQNISLKPLYVGLIIALVLATLYFFLTNFASCAEHTIPSQPDFFIRPACFRTNCSKVLV